MKKKTKISIKESKSGKRKEFKARKKKLKMNFRM